MRFPISGVETEPWLPPLTAFVVSCFTSTGGVSGAFLLLPFQMSVLGFTSPAVSPTNLVYNIVAIPSGVYRYLREGRLVRPLTWLVIGGTLPGVIAGGFIRLLYLPDPRGFKIFVACVLLYMGVRMFLDFVHDLGRARASGSEPSSASPAALDWRVRDVRFTWQRLSFEFQGARYAPSFWGIFAMALVVGVVGGVYGIGGGAIIAPFLVAIFRLPVHAVAGAALMGTFLTSIVGVAFFQLAAPHLARPTLAVAPDWPLGALFGAGGLAGMYIGARMQKHVPARWIKLMLGVLLLFVAFSYLRESLGERP